VGLLYHFERRLLSWVCSLELVVDTYVGRYICVNAFMNSGRLMAAALRIGLGYYHEI
jgi:hypothetical protein